MMAPRDIKKELTGYLRELHLPTVRDCFEERARRAEQETLSYEQYLLGSSKANASNDARTASRGSCRYPSFR